MTDPYKLFVGRTKEAYKVDTNLVSERLKALKSKAGMTTKTLSDLTDIPEDTINNILYGKIVAPSFIAVADLVRALGGSLDDFAGIAAPQDATNATSPATSDPVAELKEAFAHERSAYERGLRHRNLLIVILLVLVVLFAGWLVWDISHPEYGLIRYKTLSDLLSIVMEVTRHA